MHLSNFILINNSSQTNEPTVGFRTTTDDIFYNLHKKVSDVSDVPQFRNMVDDCGNIVSSETFSPTVCLGSRPAG